MENWSLHLPAFAIMSFVNAALFYFYEYEDERSASKLVKMYVNGIAILYLLLFVIGSPFGV